MRGTSTTILGLCWHVFQVEILQMSLHHLAVIIGIPILSPAPFVHVDNPYIPPPPPLLLRLIYNTALDLQYCNTTAPDLKTP